MQIDHEQRKAHFALGKLAAFSTTPQSAERGSAARWRAEIGSHWHREKRTKLERERDHVIRLEHGQLVPCSIAFEIPVCGTLVHRGWSFHLEGRLDQRFRGPDGLCILRELKTTLERLPRPALELRAARPEHFHQLGLYLALSELAEPGMKFVGELLYVEASTGLEQTLAFSAADRAALEGHLDSVADFLEQRRESLLRLRTLRWTPAFTKPRPGQETILQELLASTARTEKKPILLKAPTGFGKTGVLLEAALAIMQAGQADRIVYLTGKTTGQLHVLETLRHMLAPASGTASAAEPALIPWNLRPKREHCINSVFHCTRASCTHLHDLERRWKESGLARFQLFREEARDLETLRAAGLAASVCPYEIARASLPFANLWLGDFNYLFAPSNRGVFVDQATWDPARTVLIIDEAHHLPARVAEAYSHSLDADAIYRLVSELPEGTTRTIRRELEALWRQVSSLPQTDALDLDVEDDLALTLRTLAQHLDKTPPHSESLSEESLDLVRRLPLLVDWLEERSTEKLLWTPRATELRFTTLDAAPFIARELHPFSKVILASATPPPAAIFAAMVGLEHTDLDPGFTELNPQTPWKCGTYDVALDLRVDTSYRRRQTHLDTTVETLATLRERSPNAPIAAFFPSYAYAESVAARLNEQHPELRASVQARVGGTRAAQDWMDETLAFSDLIFFVLGGSFAEGIDQLGGRISHALVAGPALPEVNAVQRAKQSTLARSLGDSEAFRRTYIVPGLQKVNQALGRLVRAPGQHARVLLHCRRFADPSYAALLDPEYQFGKHITGQSDLLAWLGTSPTSGKTWMFPK